jgi:spermidine/putrescine transport system substrate-binding protein
MKEEYGMAEKLERPDGVFTRRQFLYIAGGTVAVTAAGTVLAACGTSATTAPTAAPTAAAPTAAPTAAPSAAPSAGAVGGDFNLFTWAGYDGKGVPAMDKFYADNKINLNVKNISNEVLENFLKAPGSEMWDASSDNQGDTEYAFTSGISSEITVDEVPALAKMYPFFKDNAFWKVRDGVYNSVPWTWGPIGINTRKDKVPDGIPTYEVLFDPKFTGRIGTYDDALNMVSTAAVATGNDPNFLTRDQLNGPVKDWLLKLKPQLKVLSTSIADQLNLLISGDVDVELVGLLWNLVSAKQQNINTIDFVVPKEGTFGFVDAVIIMPWAKSRANALAYANALMDGDTAVAMQESVNQMGPVAEINAKIKPEVRSLYPDDLETYINKTLKWNKFWYDPAGKYATVEEWRKVWDDVKASG